MPVESQGEDMKRFTETSKWEDKWFRALSPGNKLVFLYVVDRCDNAGFLEWDVEAAKFHLGLEADKIEGAIKGLDRAIKGASGWLWIRTFLRHQKNEFLRMENPAHRQIIGLLKAQIERFAGVEEFEEFVAPYKGLLRGSERGLASPIGIGIGKGIGKEKKGSEEGKENKGRAKSPEEVHEFFLSLGLTKEDGEWFWHKCEANGWKNGIRPILDWRATVRSWKAGQFIPSQKGKLDGNDKEQRTSKYAWK